MAKRISPEAIEQMVRGAKGGNGHDPSPNVLDLVAAESRHQSEMRMAETRRQDDLRLKQEHCDHEIAEVHLKAQVDLASAESRMRDALALSVIVR